MKTKGAIVWQPGEPWTIEELELGDPIAGEIQVRLAASGMCHSDEHLRKGDAPAVYPYLGGHEGAGIVTKVGPGVTNFQEGDHVVLVFIPACGKCVPCSKGMQNLCDYGALIMSGQSISDGTNRVTCKGQGVMPMALLGTFSPYVTVHEASAIKVRDDMPLDKAALLSCGIPTGYGSAAIVGDVQPGDAVVVVGIGGIGMNAVQGAKLAGAKYVVAIDPVQSKQDRARQFGATHTFSSMAEALEPVRDLTWGTMADKVILTVGEMYGNYVQEALDLTGKGGRTVVTGLGPFWNRDAVIDLFMFSMMQKELKGTVFGGSSPRATIPRLIDMYLEGQLMIDELITNEYKLEDINQAYADMYNGTNIRGLIRYTEADY